MVLICDVLRKSFTQFPKRMIVIIIIIIIAPQQL